MPIFKITSRTDGNQAARLIEATTRAAAVRQLAREQFDITPATATRDRRVTEQVWP